jgi:hypothetical protein
MSQFEQILTVKVVELASKETNTGRKLFVAIGTGFMRSEDFSCRGRVRHRFDISWSCMKSSMWSLSLEDLKLITNLNYFSNQKKKVRYLQYVVVMGTYWLQSVPRYLPMLNRRF